MVASNVERFKCCHNFILHRVDTLRPKGAEILGSTSPLKLDPLQCLAQRWFSPQALLSPCPEVVVLLQVLFARGVLQYPRTILHRLVPVNLLPTSR